MLEPVLPEGACVEHHDVVVLHEAFLVPCKERQHGEDEAHGGEEERDADEDLHGEIYRRG